MKLEFKPDFEAARDRWAAFWDGGNPRPMLIAIRPRPGMAPAPMPRSYDCTFGDPEPVIARTLAWAASHEFLADAIPYFRVSFAPDHLAALLGADLFQHPDSPATIWPVACLDDISKADIRFRPEGKWWRRTVEVIRAFRNRCDGRLIISGCHLQGGLDCLAALRGAGELLLDLATEPAAVHRALAQVDAGLREVQAALAREFDAATFGSMTRHLMYCRGLLDVPQCDFSALIGPEMFAEFALPSLRAQCEGLDQAVYHLDGPQAIRHLDAICTIPRVSVIQWQPGEGDAAARDWSDLHRRIDALGRGQMFNAAPADIPAIWRRFGSRRLLFYASMAEAGPDALAPCLGPMPKP